MQLPRWKLDKANWVLFRKLTTKMKVDFEGKSMEECNKMFNAELLDICTKTIPKTKPMFKGKRRHLPWWNVECAAAVKAKHRARKLWQRHRTDKHKEDYNNARSHSKDTLDKAKKEIREVIAKLSHKTNSKELWGIISRFNGKPFKPVEVNKLKNTRPHENIDKANALAQHYQTISSNQLLDPNFRERKRILEPEITQTVQASIEAGRDKPHIFTFKELTYSFQVALADR